MYVYIYIDIYPPTPPNSKGERVRERVTSSKCPQRFGENGNRRRKKNNKKKRKTTTTLQAPTKSSKERYVCIYKYI